MNDPGHKLKALDSMNNSRLCLLLWEFEGKWEGKKMQRKCERKEKKKLKLINYFI